MKQLFQRVARTTSQYDHLLLRTGLAFPFLYFGVTALIDPAGQLTSWVAPQISPFIFFPTVLGRVAGAAEIAIAVSLLSNRGMRYAAPLAAVFLLSIVANLVLAGTYEIALRDFGLFTIALALTGRASVPGGTEQ